MTTDLHYMSASEAIARFTDRTLSPVELMTAVIDRAEQVEPVVNSLCHRFWDEALAQAAEAEKRYAGIGPAPRPLEGIPTAIKEHEPVDGQPWTQGSVLYEDLVADYSSCIARRTIESGAIVHARSTGPEFGASVLTRSKLWGPTRNPWNPRYDVGGSSGGSGATLAAGTSTLATGSDLGGSIRIPASFNGVVGFKPPYGRVPSDPPYNFDTYLHYGPMARTIADTVLFQNVLAGPDDSDIVSLRPKLVLPTEYDGIEGMRIALTLDFDGWPLDPDVRANTLAVAESLRAAGAVVEVVDLPFSRALVNRAAAIHVWTASKGDIEEFLAEHEGVISPALAATVALHKRQSEGGTAEEGWTIESEMYTQLATVFRSFDAVICPTIGSSGLLADQEYPDGSPIPIGGTTVDNLFDVMMTMPFSILSQCPVLSVPSGFSSNGVPTGVQIVGPTYSDEVVFRVGAALEQVRPWFDAPERRPGDIELA